MDVLLQVQYPASKACRMSHIWDLPPTSGSIIWARQVERQLNTYMKRVEDVLGNFLNNFSKISFFKDFLFAQIHKLVK
jgi:Dynein heavy chain, N-terminal region 1